MKQRTAQEFVEDLLSEGRTARQILVVAGNTFWKNRLDEVKQAIFEFSEKLGKKYVEFS